MSNLQELKKEELHQINGGKSRALGLMAHYAEKLKDSEPKPLHSRLNAVSSCSRKSI